VVVAIAIGIAVAVWSITWEGHVRTLSCTIVSAGDAAVDYNKYEQVTRFNRRIVTENCGVFNMNNDPWGGHPNSLPAFSTIRPGATYDLTVVGWRSPIFSMTPNVIAIKLASP
jgi:hypothetical protein